MTPKVELLVDLDGVVVAFDEHLFNRTRQVNHQFWPEGYTPAAQTARFCTDHAVTSFARRTIRDWIEQPGFFYELPPLPGALDGLAVFEDDPRIELWFVTKPLEANPTCRDDKARWLETHLGLGWSRRLIIAPDKAKVDGHILLDDAPKLAWLDRARWQPVIFDRPYNRTGSPWGHLPRWSWGQPVDELLGHAR